MNKSLSLFALMIGAALFIAQMPFHSEAAPVDEPQFLSIDLADIMEDGLTTPSSSGDESATLATKDVGNDACQSCPTKTTPHHTKPTTKPTHPTKKTKPTTKPTRPTTKPTHTTKKTKPTTKPSRPTTKPTHTTKKTKPTTKPTYPTKKTKPTTKPTYPTKFTTRKPCPTVCHPHPVCPPCQHAVADEVEVADDDDAAVEEIAQVVDFE